MKLNRSEQIAFAVRCALRVFPILEQANRCDGLDSPSVIARVLVSAESDHLAKDSRLHDIARAVDAYGRLRPRKTATQADYLKAAAASVCVSAYATVQVGTQPRDDAAAIFAQNSMILADEAARYADAAGLAPNTPSRIQTRQAMANDFTMLLQQSYQTGSITGDRLDPKALGPLWPGASPEWYFESTLLK